MPFRIAYADITQIKADAIVNPTDQYYSGGGGVDRQIHEICGYKLYEATDRLPRLHLGEAKATPGFALPCKYIIHTSGPRWRDSHFLEISLLGSCYRNSIQLAHSLGCRSIAFPLVSSRGKHFPKEQALTTAIDASTNQRTTRMPSATAWPWAATATPPEPSAEALPKRSTASRKT